MAIEQNIVDRKEAESLVETMVDLIRDDYSRLSTQSKIIFQRTLHNRMAKNLGLPCCQEQQNKPVEVKPEKETGEENSIWKETIEDLELLIESCDEIPDRGSEFADSVSSSAREVLKTIERTKRVTGAQLRAIENWREGVDRWLNY